MILLSVIIENIQNPCILVVLYCLTPVDSISNVKRRIKVTCLYSSSSRCADKGLVHAFMKYRLLAEGKYDLAAQNRMSSSFT